ncbi:MAG: hypothetical protein LBM77_04205 [Spirochaetaceae bacterium]|jgi:hypothetical protein|nr:hypothetical protein [Spirochaetaceae bacterium]
MNTLAQTITVPAPVDGHIHFDLNAPATWKGGSVCVVFLNQEAPIIPPRKERRIGFMKGEIKVPDDFDTMMQDEIIAMFEGKYEGKV